MPVYVWDTRRECIIFESKDTFFRRNSDSDPDNFPVGALACITDGEAVDTYFMHIYGDEDCKFVRYLTLPFELTQFAQQLKKFKTALLLLGVPIDE